MMTRLLLLFMVVLQFACTEDSQTTDLEQTWILVEQKELTEDPINMFPGLILQFESDSLSITKPISFKIPRKPYQRDGNTITMGEIPFGKILHLSKDRLYIKDASEKYTLDFRPLQETNFNKADKAKIRTTLVTHPWILQTEDFITRLYLDSLAQGITPDNGEFSHFIVYEDNRGDFFLSENEYWTIKDISGKLILMYSKNQFDHCFFQITDVDNQRIHGQYLGYEKMEWSKGDLISVNLLSAKELEAKRQQIAHSWSIETMLKPTSEEIQALKKEWNGFDKLVYGERIATTDLSDKNLRFEFNMDKTFSIMAGERVIRKGESWDITQDGKYIVLDGAFAGYNFIEIEALDDTNLTIKKLERINIGKTTDDIDYANQLLRLKLKKK